MDYDHQPFASTSHHRILQPARSFNLPSDTSCAPSRSLTAKQQQHAYNTHPHFAISPTYAPAPYSPYSEDSFSQSDEGSTLDYGTVLPPTLIAPEEEGGYRHSTVNFEDVALPRSPSDVPSDVSSRPGMSPSESFVSSPSSMDLAGPMPSPFFVAPPARAMGRAGKSKENAPVARRELQRPPPLELAPAPQPTEDDHAVTDAPRPRAKLSTRPLSAGFPYRTHVVQIHLDHPDLSSFTEARPRALDRVRHPSYRDSRSSKSTDTSAECDLDISFDWGRQPSQAGSSVGHGSAQEGEAEATGPAPMHGLGEGAMVRSPSGRLVGTKKRVKSAVELRAKFLEDAVRAEEVERGQVAILIGAQEGLESVWRAREGPTVTQRTPSPGGSGFQFNQTDPVGVPLPDSPATSPTFPATLQPGTLGQPAASAAASPAWSFMAWWGTSAQESAANNKSATGKGSWVGEVARSTAAFVKDKAGRSAPPTPSTAQTANFPSPLFSLREADTPQDTPSTVQLEEEQDATVDELVKKQESEDVLTGLGITFGSVQRTYRPDGGLTQRRGHAAIPSLSITYAQDDASDQAEDSMVDISLDRDQLERSRSPRFSDNLHPNDHARSPSPAVEHRFAFPLNPIDAPVDRAQQHEATPAHIPGTPPLARAMVKPTWRASVLSAFSLHSWSHDHARDYMDDSLLLWETIPPAQLLFALGFLGMPWLWLVGGWFLRSDGELRGQRGRRCASAGCGCGAMKAEWREARVDSAFVKRCRVASAASGVVVTGLTGVGVWAAVSAAVAAA